MAAYQELTTQVETVNAAAKAHLIHALEAVRFDETGLRVEAALYWTHVVSTGLVTYLQTQAKRGSKALDGAGILPKRQCPDQQSRMTQVSLSASRHELCQPIGQAGHDSRSRLSDRR